MQWRPLPTLNFSVPRRCCMRTEAISTNLGMASRNLCQNFKTTWKTGQEVPDYGVGMPFSRRNRAFRPPNGPASLPCWTLETLKKHLKNSRSGAGTGGFGRGSYAVHGGGAGGCY